MDYKSTRKLTQLAAALKAIERQRDPEKKLDAMLDYLMTLQRFLEGQLARAA